jgi:hypothetical protein
MKRTAMMWAPRSWNRVEADQYSASPNAPPCSSKKCGSKYSSRTGRSGPRPAVCAAKASRRPQTMKPTPALSAPGEGRNGRMISARPAPASRIGIA